MHNYHPREVLKIAVQVEENGKAFYGAMAEATNDARLKELLTFLKKEEIKHAELFQTMLDQADELLVEQEDVEGQYDAYFHAIASNYVFTPQRIEEKIKAGFSSDIDVISFAIQMEKDAVLTYLALRKHVVPEKQHIVDAIIREEEEHLIKVTEMRDNMVSYSEKHE